MERKTKKMPKSSELQRKAQNRATCLFRVGSTKSHIEFLQSRIRQVRDEEIRKQLLAVTASMLNHAETIRAMLLGLAPEDFMAP